MRLGHAEVNLRAVGVNALRALKERQCLFIIAALDGLFRFGQQRLPGRARGTDK